jgi:hypothetical protein
MCPACLATAALVVGGATTTGGVAALALKKLRAKLAAKSDAQPSTSTERAP